MVCPKTVISLVHLGRGRLEARAGDRRLRVHRIRGRRLLHHPPYPCPPRRQTCSLRLNCKFSSTRWNKTKSFGANYGGFDIVREEMEGIFPVHIGGGPYLEGWARGRALDLPKVSWGTGCAHRQQEVGQRHRT